MPPSYSAWSKTPILTYYMAIQIGLFGIDSFVPIPLKIGPLGPYIGPMTPVGIFLHLVAFISINLVVIGTSGYHEILPSGGARWPLLPTWLFFVLWWCNVQTDEYDLQAKRYPIICTHHKLHNNNKLKSRFSRNVYAISGSIWCNTHLRHTTTEKKENNV